MPTRTFADTRIATPGVPRRLRNRTEDEVQQRYGGVQPETEFPGVRPNLDDLRTYLNYLNEHRDELVHEVFEGEGNNKRYPLFLGSTKKTTRVAKLVHTVYTLDLETEARYKWAQVTRGINEVGLNWLLNPTCPLIHTKVWFMRRGVNDNLQTGTWVWNLMWLILYGGDFRPRHLDTINRLLMECQFRAWTLRDLQEMCYCSLRGLLFYRLGYNTLRIDHEEAKEKIKQLEEELATVRSERDELSKQLKKCMADAARPNPNRGLPVVFATDQVRGALQFTLDTLAQAAHYSPLLRAQMEVYTRHRGTAPSPGIALWEVLTGHDLTNGIGQPQSLAGYQELPATRQLAGELMRMITTTRANPCVPVPVLPGSRNDDSTGVAPPVAPPPHCTVCPPGEVSNNQFRNQLSQSLSQGNNINNGNVRNLISDNMNGNLNRSYGPSGYSNNILIAGADARFRDFPPINQPALMALERPVTRTDLERQMALLGKCVVDQEASTNPTLMMNALNDLTSVVKDVVTSQQPKTEEEVQDKALLITYPCPVSSERAANADETIYTHNITIEKLKMFNSTIAHIKEYKSRDDLVGLETTIRSISDATRECSYPRNYILKLIGKALQFEEGQRIVDNGTRRRDIPLKEIWLQIIRAFLPRRSSLAIKTTLDALIKKKVRPEDFRLFTEKVFTTCDAEETLEVDPERTLIIVNNAITYLTSYLNLHFDHAKVRREMSKIESTLNKQGKKARDASYWFAWRKAVEGRFSYVPATYHKDKDSSQSAENGTGRGIMRAGGNYPYPRGKRTTVNAIEDENAAYPSQSGEESLDSDHEEGIAEISRACHLCNVETHLARNCLYYPDEALVWTNSRREEGERCTVCHGFHLENRGKNCQTSILVKGVEEAIKNLRK